MFRRRRHAEPALSSREDFWGALRGAWFAPRRFFERLEPGGGFFRPAIFASIVLYLNLLLEAALQAAWIHEFNFALIYAPFVGFLVALVLAPLLVAGLSVLVLVVLEGAPSRRGFGPVFRALGYASGIGVVLWIPYAPLLAIPYGAFVATVAVKESLNVGWRRAAAGALIPFVAVLLILLLLTGPGEAFGFLTNPPGS
ncbi:MAG TPA: YIP1 family protein [Pyrinomonadaceae bacterium]